MKSTYDIKSVIANTENSNVKVFISNIPGKKVRVSVVDDVNARNMNQGNMLFQCVCNSFNSVKESDFTTIESFIRG